MSFWKNIQKWMQQEGMQGHLSSEPISHDLIKRSPKYLEEYLKWKDSNCQKDMLAYIANNYKIWKTHLANNVMPLIF